MSPSERRLLVAVIAAGVALRVAHLVTSLGTADSVTWTRNVMLTERFGILAAYLHEPGLNHPPLALAIARLMSEAGARIGIQFPDMFRLLQTLADVVTTLALARLAGLHAASLFVLSPAAVFISGFHCQSDPLMTMFLLLAIGSRRPLLAGVLIGCAAGIKIIALVALPLLLLRFRGRDVLSCSGGAAAVLALVFAPAVAVTGTAVLRNVFGYTGLFVSWGVNYVLRPSPVMRQMITFGLLASLALLWLSELRRRSDDPLRNARVIGTALVLVLVLAPGFGVQYLFWPLPFLALMLRRSEALALHGVISAFLFAIYTAWSGGWPWWFGSHSAGVAGVWWAFGVWLALLLALAVSLVRLYPRRAA